MPPKNQIITQQKKEQEVEKQQQQQNNSSNTPNNETPPRHRWCCSFPFCVFLLSMFLPFVLPISALLLEIHYPEFHSPLRLTGRINQNTNVAAAGDATKKTLQQHRTVNDFCNFDRLHCCNASVPIQFPTTIEEIQEIVKEEYLELKQIVDKYPGAGKKMPSPLIRVVGAGHSINNLVCTSPDNEYPPRNKVIMSLDKFQDWKGGVKITPVDGEHKKDGKAQQQQHPVAATAIAWAPAGLRLKQLNDQLWEKGYALFNTGMIQEQSLAGVTATAVHGTGISNTVINERVVQIDIVLANGTLATFSKTQHPEIFKHARMHLGMFGVVVGVAFEVRDRFYVRRTEELLNEPALLDAIMIDGKEREERTARIAKNKNLETAKSYTRTQAWWFQHNDQALIQDMSEEFSSEEVQEQEQLSFFLRNPYIVQLEKIVTDFFYLVMTTISVHIPFATPLIHKLAILNHANERNYVARSYDSFTAPGVNYHSVRYSETELFVSAENQQNLLAAWKAFKEFLEENTVSSFFSSSSSTTANKNINNKRSPQFCNINSLSPLRTIAPDTIPLSPMSKYPTVAFSFTLIYRDTWNECSAMFQQKMAKFGARPHWGKWFSPMLKTKADVVKMYGEENVESFVRAVKSVDEYGLFRPMLLRNLFFK